MKKLLILSIFSVTFMAGCDKEDQIITRESINGQVQKGPFVNGSTILMYELSNSLVQTGNVFSSQIEDNSGLFKISDIVLSSQFVELSASGYYFNEILGSISPSALSLSALSDITNASTINVNILTHLEKKRVLHLVNTGKSFNQAKDQAQKDVLAIFGFQQDIGNSELLNMSVNKVGNAILIAVSVILQGDRSVGDLTELIANITTDIQQDGVLDDAGIIASLRSSALSLDSVRIRSNLEERYDELGINAKIPNFEKYITDYLSFTGLEPDATNGPATDITINSATLNGVVNAHDLSTNVTFEYGTTNAYGTTVSASQGTITGHADMSVSAAIMGLSINTTYHYRVKAVNSKGITFGYDSTFTTLGLVPSATTLPIDFISTNTAVLSGSINANYLETEVIFEYGLTDAYGLTAMSFPFKIEGSTDTPVHVNISGLSMNTLYHYRVKAVNSQGTTYGSDRTFRTAPLTVNDIDGNTYKVITVGKQVWMAENLRTTRFADGKDIPYSVVEVESPYYCWANNDISNKDLYGALYSWYVAQTGKLCPTGWHVSTDEEWMTLVDLLGGENVAGSKLKEVGTIHWAMSNEGATNETGFTALPSGAHYNGQFREFGTFAYFCGFVEFIPGGLPGVIAYRMSFNENGVYKWYSVNKSDGFSVRCVRDE